ncbi:hypothetical protein BURMUCGD1_1002 [Burkholderia multivorans CGD1]|nr:hypothetical protein BURMUCGD1_1002 [Burkholderia multivorans CGD1]
MGLGFRLPFDMERCGVRPNVGGVGCTASSIATRECISAPQMQKPPPAGRGFLA